MSHHWLHKSEVHGRSPFDYCPIELVDLPAHVVAHLGVSYEDYDEEREIYEGEDETYEEKDVVKRAEGPTPFLKVDCVVEYAVDHSE